MPFTQRGQAWEILQSWWILFTFVPFLNWIGFLYVGLRARKGKWIWYGVGYLGSIWLLGLGPLAVLYLFAFGGAIYHAFSIRGEYLQRLDALIEAQPVADEILKKRQMHESSFEAQSSTTPNAATQDWSQSPIQIGPDGNVRQTQKESVSGNAKKQESAGVRPSVPQNTAVDINSATEEEIAGLTGLTSIMAKRIVHERQARDFTSVEEIGQLLNLQPHQVVRLRDRVTFHPVVNNPQSPRTQGRIIDSGQ